MLREPWRDPDAPPQAPAITEWIRAREREREARRSYDDALLTGRFGRYLAYRLRGFAIGVVFGQVFHAVELWLLFQIFFGSALRVALVAKLSAAIAGAFYWGVLDVYRRDLRANEQARARLARAWWALSWVLAVSGTVAVVVYVSIDGEPFHYMNLYVAVHALRVVSDFPVRTLYSTAYAHGRIRRSLWWTPVIDLATLAIAYLIMGELGPYALVLALFLATVAQRAVSVVTSLRSLRERELSRPRIERGSFRAIHPALFDGPDALMRPGIADAQRGERGRQRAAKLLEAGVSGVVLRAGEALALAVVLRGALDRGDDFQIFVLFFLSAPLLSACSSWVQSFYPDLVDCQATRLTHLRRLFVRRLLLTGPLVGVALWGVGVLTFEALGFERQLGAWRWLGVVCLGLGVLAVAQLAAFAAGRFLRSSLVGVAILLAMGLIAAERFDSAITAMLCLGPIGVGVLALQWPLRWDAPVAELDTWRGVRDGVARMRPPVRLWLLRLGDLSFERTRFVADRLRRTIEQAFVAVPRRGRIIVAEPERAPGLDPVNAAVLAAGRLVAIERETCASASAAQDVLRKWAAAPALPSLEERVRRVRQRFPDAIVVDVLRGGTSALRTLPASDRGRALFALRSLGRVKLSAYALRVLSDSVAPRFIVIVRKQKGDEAKVLADCLSA